MEAIINQKVNTVNVFKVPVLTASGLIAFFLIMKAFNFHTIVEFRFLNFFIMLFGIRYAMIQKRTNENGKLKYLSGLAYGFITGLLTTAMFSIFLALYLKIDSGFMNYLISTQPLGRFLTPISTAMETMIEGTASGLIITFLYINVLNRDNDRG